MEKERREPSFGVRWCPSNAELALEWLTEL